MDSPAASTHALTMKGAQISWAILHGHKTIENRSMRMRPGWYLLHTGKGSQSAEHQQWMRNIVGAELPAEAALPHGVIVGALLIVRSLLPTECNGSVWATGPFCNVVGASCKLATPVAASGMLGLWKPIPAVLEKVHTQLASAHVARNDVDILLRTQPAAPSASVVAPIQPPCKYGAACYRMNRQHRKEYSHPPGHDPANPSLPATATATAATAVPAATTAASLAVECSPSKRARLAAADNPFSPERVAAARPGPFSDEDAAAIARLFRHRFGLVATADKWPGAEEALVQRYLHAAKHLSGADLAGLGRFGFRLLENVATEAETAALLAFVQTVTDWEERTGLPGTRRRNFGVDMDPADNYRPRSTSPLPPVLAALGARLLAVCTAQAWPAACSDIGATPAFVQAYVQRYVPGETLGFHFDERPTYAELIVGLSVCGHGRLLLGHTNGSKEVAPRALQQPNVRAIPLPPGSLYCLTGMSRYDLRHAVVQDGAAERISVTFRALK